MYLLNAYKRRLLAAFVITLSLQVSVVQGSIEEQQADKKIAEIYRILNKKHPDDMATRLTIISEQFLEKTYLLGALGEGADGDYDQSPLYRADAFDCETYVDTVLAIALANTPDYFKHCINQIRYRKGHISYINRNHFTCLDWNQNNQHQGFVKDITTTIRDRKNQSVVKFAKALIDKPSWYAHKSTQVIHLNNANAIEQEKRLTSLKFEGGKLPKTTSITPYIPLASLFDKTGKENPYLFNQIPNAAIVEIVRPNWDLTKEIGTHLNISHLGFAIWKKNTLFFREASTEFHRVVDVPFIPYLRKALSSPTIKGINIQVVLSQQDCNK